MNKSPRIVAVLGVLLASANVVADPRYPWVGGGFENVASADYSTVCAGYRNLASGNNSTVLGGWLNRAIGDDAAVGGGLRNDAFGKDSTIGGGWVNTAAAEASTVAGGWGGEAGGDFSTVGGGHNGIASGPRSTVAGGEDNAADGLGAVVSGGMSNLASANGSNVGGGYRNNATAQFAHVGGGVDNNARAEYGTIGGGQGNAVFLYGATVSGGVANMAMGEYSTVTGGWANCAGGQFSWAGGSRAKVRPFADPGAGACAGVPIPPQGQVADHGTFVWADTTASDFVSTGRDQFLIRARGGMALNANVAPLGTTLMLKARSPIFLEPANTTNLYLEHGTRNSGFNFGVVSDLVTMPQLYISKFDRSTYTNVARFLADGRFQVFMDGPIKPGGGAWAAPSDARLKRDIEPLHGALDRVLALRGVEFSYRDDAPAPYRTPGTHIGFVAQDVEKVFPDWVSKDADGYRMVGPKGFEALTVEALRELRAQTGAELAQIRAENAALRDSLDAMRTELAALRGMVAPAAADRTADVSRRAQRANRGRRLARQCNLVSDWGTIGASQ